MEIKKGYTLSQFVDKVSKENIFADETPMSEEADCFVAIYDYNRFLKQPLKKEMFVNEIEKPNGSPPFEKGIDHHHYIKWQEAEKKVIFNPKILNDYSISFLMCEETNILDVFFYNHLGEFMCKTLSDLFQATNGELELQNVHL